MRVLCILVGFAFAVVPSIRAQSEYETYTGFSVPTEAVLPGAEVHPSLWFTADEIAVVKARWNHPAYADLVAEITSDISSFKSRNPASTDPSDRPRMAKTLAFAWIVNGDLIALVKAMETLGLAYENVPQEVGSDTFDGEYDEIYRATWLQNYCAAYDWLYDRLTPEMEAKVRARLVAEAELLYAHMNSYAPRPHNHRSKPAYALGTAALTLSDHPDAAAWLSFALDRQNTVTRYMFSEDGVYREGSHYYVFTLVNAIPFLWHYRNVAGVDLFPYYQPAFEWPLRIRNGRGWMPNLEDGFMKPAPTHTVAAAYRDAPTALHGTAPLGELLQWNWATTSFFTQNYTGATNDVTWEIDVLLTWDADLPATAPDASPTQIVGSGQVAFRSGWAGDDVRYLLFHGVASADNHDHPDHLSYVLDAEGTPLAVDAGYGPAGFSDDRRSWYTSAQAHNTVTVNGFPLIDYDNTQNEGPHLLHALDTPGYDFAEMEAPSNGVAGGAEVRRGIAFPNERFWVVYDIGTSANTASYQVHLHGRGALTRDGTRMTWTAPADTYGRGGRLHAAFVGNGPLIVDETSRWTSLYWGHEEAQTYVSVRQSGTAPVFLHVLYPTPVEAPAPQVTDLSADGIVSAEIVEDDGATTNVAVQRDPAFRTAGPLGTDAAFAWVGHMDGAVRRFAVTEGHRVNWEGQDLLQATLALTAAVDRSDAAHQRLYLEPFEGEAGITLQVGADPIVGVTLNGEPIPYDELGDGRVHFSVNGSVFQETGVVLIETGTDTGVETPAGAGQALRIEGPFPNPSRGATHLRLFLPEPGHVRVTAYDLLGRRLAVLADGYRPRGVSVISWEAGVSGGGLPAGPYFIEVLTKRARVYVRGVML
ncbi:heparinase II/III-family protein [Rhodocaloribacter litoris]|uniref:heparinase II/III domain-containing protein n=1 Tax=Rhodocaloribacter litoris TaxID=2558931 RepID=UPI00141E00C5|nr:heparinase II/III family protein [Rhodocaloribacter litoris]QXD14098.1 heparinase II/III-family protein [Rhodocaloribacter litoris]